MKRICVLLVTYNRKMYLQNLIDKLMKQTYRIDTIIIVDNHSTDNTMDMLKKKGIVESIEIEENKINYKKINGINNYYYYNSVNSGGSGGFNKAFLILKDLNEKFDYIWIMDDDILPENNCLENLVNNMSDEIGICIPNRSDDKFDDYVVIKLNMNNPFLVYMQRKKKCRKLKKSFYYVEDMAFEGPLIDMNIIEKVGLPDKEYFIFYDDTDYCHRCLKCTKAKFITGAIMHKQIIPKEIKSKKMNWRNYYSYRNAIYFDKKYGKNWFVKNLSPKILILELFLKNIFLLRFYNLRIIKMSYKDAMKNKRGKTIEPGSI